MEPEVGLISFDWLTDLEVEVVWDGQKGGEDNFRVEARVYNIDIHCLQAK